MDAQRWQRVQELFEAASALAAPARGAFLDAECRDDPDLRDQIESLLRAEQQADRFIETAVDRARAQLSRFKTGTAIGPYRIDRELGRGGMGAVYLAHRADEQYQAQVAIKLIAGTATSPDVIRRFKTERQILANLHHPNIARLLDGGATEEGLPYLVMEFVDGERIDAYCDRLALDARRRIELFLAVCAAVEHAHRNLVVHRDLKPANIFVTTAGEPKLLDFGIAKLVESGAGEETGTLRFMTPTYSSPEQLRGQVITTASDVYSLAVVLYELLSGRLPYPIRELPPLEVARVISDIEPTRPSDAAPQRLRRALVGDLDVILLTALRKEPARRYPSVEQFSQDLRRYLDQRPVLARKDILRYRAGKFVRRHRVGVATTAATVAALTGVGMFAMGRVAEERDRAQLEASRADQVSRFLTQTFAVADPGGGGSGPNATARELLERGTRRIETELTGQPEAQATMFGAVGRAYQGLGLYGEATPLFERALALRHQNGAGELEISHAEYDLGGLATAMGDYPTADSLLRSALARRRAELPAGDPALIRALVALARVAFERAQYENAERLLREAEGPARHLNGEDRKELAPVLSALGEVRQRRGDYAEADTLFIETLALRRALFGENHPSVPETLHLLGMLRIDRSLADADTLLREAYVFGRRILGEDHPIVATYLRDYAALLAARARLTEADSLLRSALERHRRLLGDAHPLVADDLLGLGRVHYGDQVGEALVRDALTRMRRVYAGDHPQIITALTTLGDMVSDRGDLAGSLPYYRDAAAMARRLFGDAHDRVISPELNLAITLQWMERYAEAETLLVAAHAAAQRVLGDAHFRTDVARAELANLYLLTNRTAGAEPLLRQSLEYRRAAYGRQHPATSDVLLGLSVVAAAGGRGDEAERLAREAAPAYVAAGLDWQSALARAVLGNALLAQGRSAEAEPLLLDSYNRLRARFPNGLSYLSWVRGRLAVLYEATGRPERAAQLRRR